MSQSTSTQTRASPRPARKITTPLLVALIALTLVALSMLPNIPSSRGAVAFAHAAPSSSSASAYVGETDMGPLEFFKRSAPAGNKSANRVEPPRAGGANRNSGSNGSNQDRKMQEGSNRGSNNGNATCNNNNSGSLERQVADLKNDMTRLTQLVEQMARKLSTCNLCQNGGNQNQNQNQNRGGGGNGGGNGRERNMKDGKGKRNPGKNGGKRRGGSKKHKKGRGRKQGGKGGNRSGKKNGNNNNNNDNGGGGGQQMPPSKTVVVTAVLTNIGTAPAAVGGGAATMAAMDEAEE